LFEYALCACLNMDAITQGVAQMGVGPDVQLELLQHCPRPGTGSGGQDIPLEANFYAMRFQPITIYHYDISTNPECPSASILRRIMEQLEKTVFKGMYAVGDGKRNMFSRQPLPNLPRTFMMSEVREPLSEEELKRRAARDASRPPRAPQPDRPPREAKARMQITIKQAAVIDFAQVEEYLKGKRADLPRSALQCIDIAMRNQAAIVNTVKGRSVFYPNDPKLTLDLGGGSVLWLGHFQAVRPTQMGLMLNLDQAAVAMTSAINLLEYVTQKLGQRNPSGIRTTDSSKILRAVKGLDVETIHRERSKKFKIYGLAIVGAAADRFDLMDGRETNVAAYFEEKYQKRLAFPQLPCVRIGMNQHNLISMPMELLKICPGQRVRGIMDGRQRTAMINATAQGPKERRDNIARGRAGNNTAENPYMKTFGLDLAPMMAKIKGRIMAPPPLIMQDERSGNETSVEVNSGQWALRDKKFLASADIKAFQAIMVGGENDTPSRLCEEFLRDFIRTSQMKGLNLPNPAAMQRVNPIQVDQYLRAQRQALPPGTSLVFCFLPSDKELCYANIKRVCETELGIVSQCVDCRKVMDKKKSGPVYQTNVALKVNCKVGGANFAVPRMPIISLAPSAVIGADVHHPPIGNLLSPSIAAVVGSFDCAATKYFAVVRQQEHRQEAIQGLSDAVKELLINFYRKTSHKPHKIVMYRDGVGEGQFDSTMSLEVRAIQSACSSLEASYRPQITFIIVQKRNHARFFVGDQRHGDRNGNLLSGTIVDQAVVSPFDFDFFLCSHAGLKGTSKPTHYHVLWDDSKFSANEIQQLTFGLCHVYARCTRTVSFPAPAYYAHLAGYRARLYSDKSEEDVASVSSGGSLTIQLGQVQDSIKGYLYYC
jgi:eukaryotic translation initiation factor 2C